VKRIGRHEFRPSWGHACAQYNTEIADALDQVADLLELEQANPFRIRAYRNAARVVRGLGTEVADLTAHGEDLPAIRGIGKDLAGKIRELAATDADQDARPRRRLVSVPAIERRLIMRLLHALVVPLPLGAGSASAAGDGVDVSRG
jgi:DNA polymerase (family 10)